MFKLNRREILRIGALSVLGTVTGATWRASGAQRQGNGNQAIFIMLQGGPSHLELWDPKPQAAREIRGPFDSIPTRVPGVLFGELLQHTARIADRITVIRSMSHQFTNHIAGTYVTMTGSNNQPDQDREANPNDFPGPGAILSHQQPPIQGVPSSVSLPNWLSIPGPSNRMPGQYGGFLGTTHDPVVIEGDPNNKNFNPLSLKLADGMTPGRLAGRISLLGQLDAAARQLETSSNGERMDALRRSAFEFRG